MVPGSLPKPIQVFASRHPAIFRCLCAVLIPLVALVVVQTLPYHAKQPVFLFFEAGIALATWLGGWETGAVALAESVILIIWLTHQTIYAPLAFRMVLSSTYSAGIIWVVARLRSSQQALRESEGHLRRLSTELEQRVAERTDQLNSANSELLGEIAERKHAVEALRRSESYLAQAQQLTHSGSWAYVPRDGDWAVQYWSGENFRIWGFDPDEGLPAMDAIRQRIHPDDRSTAFLCHRPPPGGLTHQSAEWRILLPDGTVRHILSLNHPMAVGTEAGEIMGTDVDITGRRNAEKERERLRQLEADLLHLNRVSTLGELAASLSHELKQPIAATITSAGACLAWLQHEVPSVEKARESLGRIIRDSRRAEDIINGLRSLYARGTGGAPAKREMIDVNEVLVEMIAMLRCEAQRHGIDVRLDTAHALEPVWADRVQLQQVLLNLMVNSIEAMKETGGELTIRSELGPDGQLLVSVIDTGVGLPAANPDEIFNAFFTTKKQGSGMGLTICRSIVESHAGWLEAVPNQPQGAIFRFSLPYAPDENAAAGKTAYREGGP